LRRKEVADGLEAVEFVDGAVVGVVGLGLAAEEAAKDLVIQAEEVVAERVVGRGFAVGGGVGGLEAGEDGAFQAVAAEDGLLGAGDLIEDEEFLGVDGPVEVDEVFAQAGEFGGVLWGGGGIGVGVEAVAAGVLGGAALPSSVRGPVDWAVMWCTT